LGLRVSLTDSAASAGIYQLISKAVVHKGELVGACLPSSIAELGLAHGYLHGGDCPAGAEPVAKIAGALPGDIVNIEPRGVAVNGSLYARSAVASHDSKGRPLPHVSWGTRKTGQGEVWLFGFNNLHSWDARYYGPIPLSNVRGELRPILTW
jgi:conjugative transfer signal peptidase TraF